jgi:hypothetical protein
MTTSKEAAEFVLTLCITSRFVVGGANARKMTDSFIKNACKSGTRLRLHQRSVPRAKTNVVAGESEIADHFRCATDGQHVIGLTEEMTLNFIFRGKHYRPYHR